MYFLSFFLTNIKRVLKLHVLHKTTIVNKILKLNNLTKKFSECFE